jgi:hypothetical protein
MRILLAASFKQNSFYPHDCIVADEMQRKFPGEGRRLFHIAGLLLGRLG